MNGQGPANRSQPCQSTDPQPRSSQMAAESGPTRDGEAADRLSLNVPTRNATRFTATERTAAAPPIQAGTTAVRRPARCGRLP
jgi:hypothetical protein